jgi:hypothetical protein
MLAMEDHTMSARTELYMTPDLDGKFTILSETPRIEEDNSGNLQIIIGDTLQPVDDVVFDYTGNIALITSRSNDATQVYVIKASSLPGME